MKESVEEFGAATLCCIVGLIVSICGFYLRYKSGAWLKLIRAKK